MRIRIRRGLSGFEPTCDSKMEDVSVMETESTDAEVQKLEVIMEMEVTTNNEKEEEMVPLSNQPEVVQMEELISEEVCPSAQEILVVEGGQPATPVLNQAAEAIDIEVVEILPYRRPGGARLGHLSPEVIKGLPFHEVIEDLIYQSVMFVEEDPNGGAWLLRAKHEDQEGMSPENKIAFADEFLKLLFSEDEEGHAYFVIGVLQDEAKYIPDVLDFLTLKKSDMRVKVGNLEGTSDTTSLSMEDYKNKVYETYSHGTYRHGPLIGVSLVSSAAADLKDDTAGGDYFPELLHMLDANIMLERVLPWGDLAKTQGESPQSSKDGPFITIRPGEQFIPTTRKPGMKPGRTYHESLRSYDKGFAEPESIHPTLFEDGTKAHYKYTYDGRRKLPVAVVGVQKAVHCGEQIVGKRRTMDIVAFHAADFDKLVVSLELDVDEAPDKQCKEWQTDPKLNTMRREGIRYSKIQLFDNDVYLIPRSVIHQVRTVSATSSIDWQMRLNQYYPMPILTPQVPMSDRIKRPIYQSDAIGIDLQSFNSRRNTNLLAYFPKISTVSLSMPTEGEGQFSPAAGVTASGPSGLALDKQKKRKKRKSQLEVRPSIETHLTTQLKTPPSTKKSSKKRSVDRSEESQSSGSKKMKKSDPPVNLSSGEGDQSKSKDSLNSLEEKQLPTKPSKRVEKDINQLKDLESSGDKQSNKSISPVNSSHGTGDEPKSKGSVQSSGNQQPHALSVKPTTNMDISKLEELKSSGDKQLKKSMPPPFKSANEHRDKAIKSKDSLKSSKDLWLIKDPIPSEFGGTGTNQLKKILAKSPKAGREGRIRSNKSVHFSNNKLFREPLPWKKQVDNNPRELTLSRNYNIDIFKSTTPSINSSKNADKHKHQPKVSKFSDERHVKQLPPDVKSSKPQEKEGEPVKVKRSLSLDSDKKKRKSDDNSQTSSSSHSHKHSKPKILLPKMPRAVDDRPRLLSIAEEKGHPETEKKADVKTSYKSVLSNETSKLTDRGQVPTSQKISPPPPRKFVEHRVPPKKTFEEQLVQAGPNEIILKKKEGPGVLRKIVPAKGSPDLLSGIMSLMGGVNLKKSK